MFENLLTERSDAIDNAAYQLILALTGNSEDDMPWNMEYIGPVVDAAVKALNDEYVSTCRPCYINNDDETPCYQMSECDNPDCPMRN